MENPSRKAIQRPKQPKEILEEMVTLFSRPSNALLQITGKDFITRSGGVYAKVFAKCSKRLAKSLSVEREILVLFTSFTDLQQRTIATAKEIIDEESGRLESTVVVIVHADPRGNYKLKNWGREKGLTVLPVYLKEDSISSINQEEFEKQLCQELFSYDPFDVSGPVSDDSQFYGRRTEAQDLARQLQQGQIKSCLGIRKIGKTSILNRVVSVVKSHHSCHCVMIDCSIDSIWAMTAGQLLHSIASSLSDTSSLGSYSSIEPIDRDISIVEGSKKLLDSIKKVELPVVIFFDEVDYITPGSPTEPRWEADFNEFWRNLRASYQEASRLEKRFSLLISGVSSKWFRVGAINGVENAALSFIPEEYLSTLPRGASNAMIRSLARVAGLQFDEYTADLIGEYCSDIPFWIRKACSYIHRNIETQIRPHAPDRELILSLLERFNESEGGTLAKVALMHLFRVYPELEEVVKKCHEGKSSDCPKQYLSILGRYGVISTQRQQYIMSGKMMDEGFKLYLEEKEDLSEHEHSNNVLGGSFSNSDEWAEELAVLSRERNLIEKSLRSIVLNFIRSDSLKNKQAGKTKERLLSVIRASPAHRKSFERGVFDSLSPDQTMEKFYWLDLKSLVEKNWNLFGELFNNRKLFSEHCEKVNERPDAHAKDIDRVGIAQYRDSLNWLKERISN